MLMAMVPVQPRRRIGLMHREEGLWAHPSIWAGSISSTPAAFHRAQLVSTKRLEEGAPVAPAPCQTARGREEDGRGQATEASWTSAR